MQQQGSAALLERQDAELANRVHAMACAMVAREGSAAADSNGAVVIAAQALKLVRAIDAALLAELDKRSSST